jgi:SAM-dependent methyltransferase
VRAAFAHDSLAVDAVDGGTTYAGDRREIAPDQGRERYPELPLFERHHKVLDLAEGESVLDVGCYTGTFVCEAIRRFPKKNVLGIDYSAEHIRIAQLLHPDMRDRFRCMSVYKLPLEEESFDCVTLQEALEHLEGAALAVKEINRVLKRGGVLIISIPNPFFVGRLACFVQSEGLNAWRSWTGRPRKLRPEILSSEHEWDRHLYAWTPETLLALLAHNGFEYVLHCYENGMPDVFRRCLLRLLPFLGPTLIIKVRKIAPAPGSDPKRIGELLFERRHI